MRNIQTFILEKLKVSSRPENNFKFKCKVKDFFLWYWNYEVLDDDFWDAMYEIEFPNNVIEDVFDGSTNEFIKWLEPRLDDIMYFNEKILNIETIQYDFLIDDIEFKLWSYSDDSNINRFSKVGKVIRESKINEKLRISNSNNGLKTSIAKFVAWFTGRDEWRINRNTIEDFDQIIDENRSLSRDEITNILYKHLHDSIYINEDEENKYSQYTLYKYSFELDGYTFICFARIYGDSELLSADSKYLVTEKLQISNKTHDTTFTTTVDKLFKQYLFLDPNEQLYTQHTLTILKDCIDIYDENDLLGNVVVKYFRSDITKFQDWLCKFKKSEITVFETLLDDDNSKPYGIEVKYEFDLDNKHIGFMCYFNKYDELYSNVFVNEKLKISNKERKQKYTVKSFFNKYLNRKFKYDDLVGFFSDIRKEHFCDNVYDLIEFFKEHSKDKIEVLFETEDIIDGFGEVERFTFTLGEYVFSDIIVIEFVDEKLKISMNNQLEDAIENRRSKTTVQNRFKLSQFTKLNFKAWVDDMIVADDFVKVEPLECLISFLPNNEGIFWNYNFRNGTEIEKIDGVVLDASMTFGEAYEVILRFIHDKYKDKDDIFTI